MTKPLLSPVENYPIPSLRAIDFFWNLKGALRIIALCLVDLLKNIERGRKLAIIWNSRILEPCATGKLVKILTWIYCFINTFEQIVG